MTEFLKLLRVEQWVKNAFVFIPIVFSGNLFEVDKLLLTILSFFIFSLTASCIYIINDYKDIASDKNHPKKKFRPLASGAVSKKQAIILLSILLITTIVVLSLVANVATIYVITGYFILNLLYTFKLKSIAILDVTIISLGFVLRVLVGGSMTGIEVSQWTILLTFTLALVLALGKRRGELVNDETLGLTRKSLQGYNLEFINVALSISCVLVIVSYMMFTLAEETQSRFHTQIFYTVLFVILGILRFLQQTFVYNKTESPTKMVYKDLFLQLILIGWTLSVIGFVYFK
jgi:decaprenyl-phosphate phosphoribosyltransferase